MGELYMKTAPGEQLTKAEIAFMMIFFALARVENQEVKKTLIEAIALLASDE